MQVIALDCHKRYSLASVETKNGKVVQEQRINHRPGSIEGFLGHCEAGSAVAVETVGNWYWIVDEIEHAGMKPKLVHARKAKLMLGSINKTDKLDVRGLNKLQRVGTLPEVWIPPGDLRDQRELPRTRMVFAAHRTRLKNRIHSVLDKYGLQYQFEGISDIFGRRGREIIDRCVKRLPKQTGYTLGCLLDQLDVVQEQIKALERRMKEVFKANRDIELLMTMPGVGFILAVVIWLEVGDIERFCGPGKLAGYSGSVPSVHSSGGKIRFGRLRVDTNHYLKWAFSEAGNSVAVNRRCWPWRYVVGLYDRIRGRRNHSIAIGAVARHLAESTYWILSKREVYRERGIGAVSPTRA